MPLRIATCTINMERDGKLYVPPIGEPSNFTVAEIKEIEGLSPRALRKAAEDGPVPGEDDVSLAHTGSTPVSSGAGAIVSPAKGADGAVKPLEPPTQVTQTLTEAAAIAKASETRAPRKPANRTAPPPEALPATDTEGM